MTPRPLSDDEGEMGERFGRFQGEQAAMGMGQMHQMQRPQQGFPHSMTSGGWNRPNVSAYNNMQSASTAGGFNMPPPGGNPNSYPQQLYERAMLQQKLASLEQSRMQMMSQQALTMPSPATTMPPPMQPTTRRQRPRDLIEQGRGLAHMASQRLAKRRRIMPSRRLLASRRVLPTRGSWPMPRLEEGYESPISIELFRQTWELLEIRAKGLFPNDMEKQREYVKWRFLLTLRGNTFVSGAAARKGTGV